MKAVFCRSDETRYACEEKGFSLELTRYTKALIAQTLELCRSQKRGEFLRNCKNGKPAIVN